MMICNNFIIIIIIILYYIIALCQLLIQTVFCVVCSLVCFNINLSVWIIFITELISCNRQFSDVQWESILGPKWLFICSGPWPVALCSGKGN
jgi:hypothetical protein